MYPFDLFKVNYVIFFIYIIFIIIFIVGIIIIIIVGSWTNYVSPSFDENSSNSVAWRGGGRQTQWPKISLFWLRKALPWVQKVNLLRENQSLHAGYPPPPQFYHPDYATVLTVFCRRFPRIPPLSFYTQLYYFYHWFKQRFKNLHFSAQIWNSTGSTISRPTFPVGDDLMLSESYI